MNDLVDRIAEPDRRGAVTLWWLGQAGFIISAAGLPRICIDPYLSDSCAVSHGLTRRFAPPLTPRELGCSVVLATHWHPDHLDPDTIRVLVEVETVTMAGPPSCVQRVHRWGFPKFRTHQLEWGDSLTIAPSLEVTAVPASHRVPGAICEDAVGYLIRAGQTTLLHTGDTEYNTTLRAIEPGAVDVLMLPFNGSGGNLDVLEAAFVARRLRPRAVVPMHFGMWADYDEPEPAELETAYRSLGGDAQFIVPDLGKPIIAIEPGGSS